MLLSLLYSNSIKANDVFLKCLNNSNSKSKIEILIFYNPNCQYCLNMESEIMKNNIYQKKLLKNYHIKLIDMSTISGKNIGILYNVNSTPTLIKYNIKENKIFTQIGFNSIKNMNTFLNEKTNKKLKKQFLSTCGNDIIECGEVCDDGNLINGDGCDNDCNVTGSLCGNGIINAGEVCDDGNMINGDGCDNSCTITPLCGNSIVECGESCDDGNTTNGDGCENSCTVTLGINDFEINKLNVKIIPNPSNNNIQIQREINQIDKFAYKILDLTGRIVKSGNSKYYEQINIDSLTSGNYILQIETEKGEKLTEKLVKN